LITNLFWLRQNISPFACISRFLIMDIEFLADPTAGEVRVGCNEPMAAGFVPAVIERLGRHYPVS